MMNLRMSAVAECHWFGCSKFCGIEVEVEPAIDTARMAEHVLDHPDEGFALTMTIRSVKLCSDEMRDGWEFDGERVTCPGHVGVGKDQPG
jgi:hypothetical protein